MTKFFVMQKHDDGLETFASLAALNWVSAVQSCQAIRSLYPHVRFEIVVATRSLRQRLVAESSPKKQGGLPNAVLPMILKITIF